MEECALPARHHMLTCSHAKLLVLRSLDPEATLGIHYVISIGFTTCVMLAVMQTGFFSIGIIHSSCGTRMGEVGFQLSGQSL